MCISMCGGVCLSVTVCCVWYCVLHVVCVVCGMCVLYGVCDMMCGVCVSH